eukprot:4284034-Karenia_brevis.AAC.1
MDEKIWEESRTTITGRRMLLVSLYERNTWDYQHISHSVMTISKCRYPGDHKIGEFLTALRKIIYGSHDSDWYKIDDTPQ